MGLAASVGLLRAIEATGKPENVLGVWAAVQVEFSPMLPMATEFILPSLQMGYASIHGPAVRASTCG